MDLVFLLTLAIVAGATVGIVPGLTPLLGLMFTMPFIASYSPEEIILYWACFLLTVQYYGSVSALLFKVPGETSSLPVLGASVDLTQVRSIIRSYKLTAFTSLIASLIAVAAFYLLFVSLDNSWHVLFSVKFSAIFILIIIGMLLIYRGQYLLNFIFLASGIFVANMPDVPYLMETCGTHPWSCFTIQQIDIALAVMGLYAVPHLFDRGNFFAREQMDSKLSSISWIPIIKYYWYGIKYGLMGCFTGFVPGLGVTLSSNLAGSIEVKKNKYKRLRVMAAAEAANNSASIASMVPFLMIGIPITATEVYLDNWLTVFKATYVDMKLMYGTFDVYGFEFAYFEFLSIALAFIAILCFVLTSRFIGFYQLLNRLPPKMFDIVIKLLIVLFVMLTFQEAGADYVSSAVNLLVFSIIGIWASRKHVDIIALPIALVIGRFAVERLTIAYTIWIA